MQQAKGTTYVPGLGKFIKTPHDRKVKIIPDHVVRDRFNSEMAEVFLATHRLQKFFRVQPQFRGLMNSFWCFVGEVEKLEELFSALTEFAKGLDPSQAVSKKAPANGDVIDSAA